MTTEPLGQTLMLGLRQFCEQYDDGRGVNERTVKRWLAQDELPGAVQDPVTRVWSIPADARRTPVPRDERPTADTSAPAGVAELVAHPGYAPGAVVARYEAAPALLDRLQDLPAYLTVAQASEYLGVPRARITAHPDEFDARPFGVGGSLRVPQATVRRIAGI